MAAKKHPKINKKHLSKKFKKERNKEEKVMHEFKEGELHSGSKNGPLVKSKKQAIAIALSEARKAGEKVKPKPAKEKPVKAKPAALKKKKSK